MESVASFVVTAVEAPPSSGSGEQQREQDDGPPDSLPPAAPHHIKRAGSPARAPADALLDPQATAARTVDPSRSTTSLSPPCDRWAAVARARVSVAAVVASRNLVDGGGVAMMALVGAGPP